MTKIIFTQLMLLYFLPAALLAQDASANVIMTKKYDKATNLVVWPEEFNPEKAKFYVRNEIDITAKPAVVWDILIHATAWHTFYRGAQSPVAYLDTTASSLNKGLTFTFHTMGLRFKPIVDEFVSNERLAWTSRIRSIQGYHAWVIVPTATGCRLITAEAQNGFLTFLQKVFQPNKLLKLHDTWLKQIKARAERQMN